MFECTRILLSSFSIYWLLSPCVIRQANKKLSQHHKIDGRRNYLPWLFPLAGGENKVYRVGELEREEKEARSSKREREGERKEERRESAAIDTAKKKKDEKNPNDIFVLNCAKSKIE